MMRASLARRLVAMAVPVLLLAACTGSDGNGDGDPPGTSPSASQPATTGSPGAPAAPLAHQEAASDGATVEVGEVDFTVLDERASGSAVVAWAVVFENTSESDLLAYVDFELSWRSTGGDTETFPWNTSSQQRAYDVLPGRTTVVGGIDSVGFVPESLGATVHTDQWYPMRELAAHGLAAGVEVTGASIEVANAVRVSAGYTSSYEGREFTGEEDLRLLVVLRDAAGELLGAVAAADFGVPPPGSQEQQGSVPRSDWPDAADADASEVAITKVCCSWVGVS